MEQTTIKKVNRPELVKVGNRSVSAIGWSVPLVEDHLKWHLGQMKDKWCSVDCMARTMFGRASEVNRSAVRKRIAPTFRKLLEVGLLLIIEYDNSNSGHGKIKAVKFFERASQMEAEFAPEQVKPMTMRKEMNERMRVMALEILAGAEHAGT